MTDLYEMYIKERENLDVIKNEHGFIAYRIDGDECLISDYFVHPDFRKNGIGYSLADQVFDVCIKMKVKTVYCQTDVTANGHELSRLTIENYGFEHYLKDGNIDHFKMEITYG